jgi:glycosyltransferase involved in cell wall biosynthesis
MKIGLDARFLTHPQLGGFKTYTVNLVTALGQVDHANQYVIYLDRTPIDGSLPEFENFCYRIVPAALPVIGMPFREQISLRRQIAKDNLDVVHFLCNTAPLQISAKFIVSLHDVIQVVNAQALFRVKGLRNFRQSVLSAYSGWAIKNTARFADRVITVSNYEKGQIIKTLEIAPERVCVTYLAPNSVYSLAEPDVKSQWRTDFSKKFGLRKRFILGIGYEPRKNIELLIGAFSNIASSWPDLDLVIIAAQEVRRVFFQQLAEKLGLSDRVIILASIQPNELAILYNLAEAFVFPSERESFGLPPLEALACGTPTIAMNTTSLPEILGNGAVLIDGKDEQTWANAILRVLTDEKLRVDLVNRGLKQANKLTWQQCAQNTIQVYQTVVEGKR